MRSNVLTYLWLAVITAGFLLPLVWMVSSSFKGNQEIFQFPPSLLPKHWMWSNYSDALTYIPFFRYLTNTLIISVGNVAGSVISTPPIAYAFSKLEWKGRNFMFGLCLATIMLPFVAVMIPQYTMFKQLGWINTFWPLIAPAFFGSPMFIFLMRQFYLGIPRELTEAAKIDGAGDFLSFWILMPLMRSPLISVSLFAFLGSWTDFLAPLIFLNDSSKFTLSLGLQQFQSVHFTAWSYLMAACVVFTLPVTLLFFVLQRHFVQGITFTAVKG